MRAALKYGAPVAAIFAAWVLLKRLWMPWEGPDRWPWLDSIIFNLPAITAMTLAVRARRARNGGKLTIGQGVVAGTAVAVAYAVLLTLFFIGVYAVVGKRLLAGVAADRGIPERQALVQAFGGILFGSIAFGAVVSTVIALILRKK